MRILLLCLLTSCSSFGFLQDVAKDVTEIETKDVISLNIDKDAFQKSTDVDITVKIINKDPH